MCLYFNNISNSQRRDARIQGKPVIAYKILRRAQKKLYGPYRKTFEWKPGLNISDRGEYNYGHGERLTKEESERHYISPGLHLMMNLRDAWREANDLRENPNDRSIEVWEVKVDPKQIVAYGNFYGTPALVAHKVELVRRVLKREKKK